MELQSEPTVENGICKRCGRKLRILSNGLCTRCDNVLYGHKDNISPWYIKPYYYPNHPSKQIPIEKFPTLLLRRPLWCKE